MYFFPTPYPGPFQAATDLYNNVNHAQLFLDLDNLNPGNLFQMYQNYAGVGALTTFFDNWASLAICARAELGDELCLIALDIADRGFLWDVFHSLYP